MRKIKIFLASIVAVIAMVFMVNLIFEEPVYADPSSPIDIIGLVDKSRPVMTCALDNVGWLVCPVLRSSAKAADYAFTFITKSFLVIETSLFKNGSGGTESAWSLIRNFANGIFVISALVVVYSLFTGAGLSRYNLMKVVPRFLVMAILVNISFYLCQAMIDIANIIGYGIINSLNGIANTIGPSVMPISDSAASESMPVLTEVTSSILGKVDVAWALLAPVAAVVLFAALICSVMIVVLIARKTFVIALVLAAPLALVAFLLPNTEQYFKKWLNLFIQTLMLFPVIAFLLGVGQIVSSAIVQSGDSNYKIENDQYTLSKPIGGKVTASSTVHLVAAGAAVLPLAATWYVFKFVLNGASMASMYVRRGGKPNNYSNAQQGANANKKDPAGNMFSQGLRRLQNMASGEGSDNLSNKMGLRRGRKKQQKSEEQVQFERQVESRLKELRASGASAQDHYARTVRRYQNSQIQSSTDSRQLNVNNFDSIELKAAEAYLLENISKGDLARDGLGRSNQTRNSFGNQNSNQDQNQNNDRNRYSASDNNPNRFISNSGQNEGLSASGKDQLSAPTITKLAGNQISGGGGNVDSKARAARSALTGSGLSSPSVSSGSTGASSAVIQGGPVSANNVVVVQGGPSLADSSISTGYSIDGISSPHHQQTDTEMKAKARAAKFVMSSQEIQAGDINDIFEAGKKVKQENSDSTSKDDDLKIAAANNAINQKNKNVKQQNNGR